MTRHLFAVAQDGEEIELDESKVASKVGITHTHYTHITHTHTHTHTHITHKDYTQTLHTRVSHIHTYIHTYACIYDTCTHTYIHTHTYTYKHIKSYPHTPSSARSPEAKPIFERHHRPPREDGAVECERARLERGLQDAQDPVRQHDQAHCRGPAWPARRLDIGGNQVRGPHSQGGLLGGFSLWLGVYIDLSISQWMDECIVF